MLPSGSRLGPYEILAPLGAGGMGEVYRARDPRLGREVAVKVLPAAVSADPDRLRRFEQEARAASALNHPNILTVFDTGTQDGVVYLVTELLEGETLRERLTGALPARKAVEIAVQVARGLAAAHGRGIIHRDVKPENLFLTRDGRVKILDFGLAKLRAHGLGSGSLEAASTAPAKTRPGMVLGSAGYMAPEQIRGLPVAPCADLFALGAVLYEMLAGRRAFRGDSAAETMAAILREEPPDLAESGKAIPPGLDRVLRHCLEKDPRHRFQSASDLAFGLESLPALSGAGTGAPAAPAGRRHLLWAMAVGGVLATLAAAVLAGILLQRRLGPSEPPRLHRLTFRRGNVVHARFAPDGQTIVYSATWDGGLPEIYTTRTDSPESRPLGLPPAFLHSISPQGEMLISLLQEKDGVFIGDTLARAPLAGGAPRPIQQGFDGISAAWAPDGETFALLHQDEHGWRLEYPRGTVVWRSAVGNVMDVEVAPAGDAIALCERQGFHQLAIVMLDRAGKVITRSDGWSRRIIGGGNSLGCSAWAPDGKELWFAAARPGKEAGLYALTRRGEARAILHVPGVLVLFDIARDGRVLFSHVNRRDSIMAHAPGETGERDLSWFEGSELADLALDGRFILFTEQGEGGGERSAVYLRDTDGSPAVRLGDGLAQALSPDGRWALARSATDARQLFLLPTGAGEPRALPPAPVPVQKASWLASGKQILFRADEPGSYDQLYVMDVGGKQARPVSRPGNWFWVASPDSSTVATYGLSGLQLYSINGGEPRAVPGVLPLVEVPIQWRKDGRALYVGRASGVGGYRIDEVDIATGKRVLWKELRLADPAGAGIRTVMMTPGGEAYAYHAWSSLSTLYLAEGLR